jgi:hypothetical protein
MKISLILEFIEPYKTSDFNVYLNLTTQASKMQILLYLKIMNFVSTPKTFIRILIKLSLRPKP